MLEDSRLMPVSQTSPTRGRIRILVREISPPCAGLEDPEVSFEADSIIGLVGGLPAASAPLHAVSPDWGFATTSNPWIPRTWAHREFSSRCQLAGRTPNGHRASLLGKLHSVSSIASYNVFCSMAPDRGTSHSRRDCSRPTKAS